MQKNIFKKSMVIGLIILVVGASVTPFIGGTIEKNKYKLPISNGNTLYVGGNETGNYTKIQDAIDDAVDGDTIFVYNYSSPYYENIIIDKSISLIGEDRDSTIIDANGDSYVLRINKNTDWVNISGFTIRNTSYYLQPGIGIEMKSNYTNISGNNIISNQYAGIFATDYVCNNTISGNVISNNGDYDIIFRDFCNYNNIYGNNISLASSGIWIENSIGNFIENNEISNIYGNGICLISHSNGNIILNSITMTSTSTNLTYCGIDLSSCEYNNITNNDIIDNNGDGIAISWQSCYNRIDNNIINNNEIGIVLDTFAHHNNININHFEGNSLSIKLIKSNSNSIKNNNFYDNKSGDFFAGNIEFSNSFFTIWNHNFWGEPVYHSRIIKRILGKGTIGDIIKFPMIQRDFFPAITPN